MKTKLQIIQSLLDERKITAEEAMILMQAEKEYVPTVRWQYPWYGPDIPCTPLAPTWHNGTASNDAVVRTTTSN